MTTRVLVIAIVGAACGGTYGGHAQPVKPTAPSGGIEAAGLPYQIVDARTGHSVDTEAFWTKLAAARAICVGEDHPNPHHHWVQLETVKQLGHRLGPGKLALGMEMVQKPFQGVLDDFTAKRIDESALRSRTGWGDRWGYDYALYGPTIVAAVAAGGSLVALNAPDELRKKISHHGLESLTPDERAQVPELKLDDVQHRAWFDALMEGMGGSTAHSAKPEGEDANNPHDAAKDKPAMPKDHPEMPSPDRIYMVQVLWDETMADTAAKWLKANPNGHLVILAGNGHCHDSAIVNRIKRRGIAQTISIHPVLDDGEGGVAEALAKPINDYVVVLQLPPDQKPKADDQHP